MTKDGYRHYDLISVKKLLQGLEYEEIDEENQVPVAAEVKAEEEMV